MKISIVLILFGFGFSIIALTFAENDPFLGWHFDSWSQYKQRNDHCPPSEKCCYNQTFANYLLSTFTKLTVSCVTNSRMGFPAEQLRTLLVNCIIPVANFVNLTSCTYTPLLDFVAACPNSTVDSLDEEDFDNAVLCMKPYIDAFYRCQYRCEGPK